MQIYAYVFVTAVWISLNLAVIALVIEMARTWKSFDPFERCLYSVIVVVFVAYAVTLDWMIYARYFS